RWWRWRASLHPKNIQTKKGRHSATPLLLSPPTLWIYFLSLHLPSSMIITKPVTSNTPIKNHNIISTLLLKLKICDSNNALEKGRAL
ncbi:MAG: hypothetical protein WCD45_10380, partial [Gallionella sp.]